VPSFVNYKKRCTRLAAASDKVYQLLAHGWWFSPGTLASSTTKTSRHDIAEILLKVALNTKNQIKSSSLLKTFIASSYSSWITFN
jgi:small-conductance mechanosensitive channel